MGLVERGDRLLVAHGAARLDDDRGAGGGGGGTISGLSIPEQVTLIEAQDSGSGAPLRSASSLNARRAAFKKTGG